MQNKEKINSSLMQLKEITEGFDNYFMQKEVQNNKIEKVEQLLKEEKENSTTPQDIVNIRNSDGYSLLMLSKTAAMSKLLIENGAEVNYVAPDGTTALLLAVKNNNKEQVETLLRAGAKAEIKDLKTGYNALMLSQNNDISYLLLKAGANPNFMANDGLTPLSKATKDNNHQLLNMLHQFGAQINWSDVIKK